MSVKPSVLILQRILPPYRLALFQSLSKSPHFHMDLAYGQAAPSSALESISDPAKVSARPLTNLYFRGNEKLVYQKGVSKLLASRRYDTLIAEFNPRIITNVLAAFQAKRLGMRLIWWGHGIRPRSSSRAVKIYLALTKIADAFLFYNEEGADKMAALGVPREKLFIAWNSVDTDEIERLRQNQSLNERFRIVSIGRLIPEKKTDLLIRGFAAALPNLSPATRLTIIGEGPERAKLEALAAQCNLGDQVEFTGSLYEQEQLAPYFNSAWVSVSSGYIGLSAIHSLAFGVPMLVAETEPHSPEIAAIEPDVNAVYFRSDDIPALAAALTALAANPARWEAMSLAARRTIQQRFSIGAMLLSFEAAIQFAQRFSTSEM